MGPFATATEFSEYTGMVLPSDLARLQSMLAKASAEIRGFTGQTLSQVTGDVAVFPSWSSVLIILPQRPVTAVTSVVVDAVTVPATDYTFTSDGNLWRLDNETWASTTVAGSAAVTYTHGYAETSQEFERIKTICIDITARAYERQGSAGGFRAGSTSQTGSEFAESAGWAPDVFLTATDQYKLSSYMYGVMA